MKGSGGGWGGWLSLWWRGCLSVFRRICLISLWNPWGDVGHLAPPPNTILHLNNVTIHVDTAQYSSHSPVALISYTLD